MLVVRVGNVAVECAVDDFNAGTTGRDGATSGPSRCADNSVHGVPEGDVERFTMGVIRGIARGFGVGNDSGFMGSVIGCGLDSYDGKECRYTPFVARGTVSRFGIDVGSVGINSVEECVATCVTESDCVKGEGKGGYLASPESGFGSGGGFRSCDRAVGSEETRGQAPDVSGVPSLKTQANRLKREKKKKRKERKKEMDVPEWRRKSPVVEVAEAKSRGELGYYSNLPADVKKRLQRSRAEMMVAQNELKTRKAREELKRMEYREDMESPLIDVLNQVQAVVGKMPQIRDVTNKKTQEWVQTLVESAVTEVSAKAPSSVPSISSIDSVGSKSVNGDSRKAGTGNGERKKRKGLFSLSSVPPSPVELAALDSGLINGSGLLDAREKAGRQLALDDFFRKGAPKVTKDQRWALLQAIGVIEELDPHALATINYHY